MSSQEHWPPTPSRGTDPSARRPDGVATQTDGKDVFDGLTSRRRRLILAILVDGSDAVPSRELARRLGAVEAGVIPADVPDDRVDVLLADLRHVQLPTLADVGLLEWDEVEETVSTADHPAFDDPTFRTLLESGADVDDVVECLACERRRTVLAALSTHEEPVERAALARQVAAYEPGPDTTEDVLVSLHHVHLPKLDDAGLVERDRQADTVGYRSHRSVDEAWFSA